MAIEVGFYGKLPSHGDFLRRRVSDGFVSVWDAWLQESLATSRTALADGWLDVYLTSPVWRFACGPGACGARSVLGIMVPSVDRVGRYFPLTVVAELPADVSNLLVAMLRAESFFDALERIVIDTLEGDTIDIEGFDEQLIRAGAQLDPARLSPPTVLIDPSPMLDDPGNGWHIAIGSAGEIASAFEQVVAQRLADVYDPMVLWCTDGSSRVQPCCLMSRGLPHPDSFAALLDGSWAARHWRSVQARVDISAAPEILVDDPAPPQYRSAAASNTGRVREINQDSFLEHPDAGIWGVADGLGGHSDGEVASRMVCDALADIVVDSSFEHLIDVVRQRVGAVNEQLVRAATRPVNAVHSGSTVVALLARGTSCAILWAGDSRAYRWRNGDLEQLTSDHSLAVLEGLRESNAITRAVGGEATLDLDLIRDRVLPGDRFLLCSDGLTKTLSKEQLASWMAHEDIHEAVDGLITATLEAGAPDNVTALVVEAVA